MSIDEYYKARRMGLRAYNANMQSRKSPYLLALDEIVENVEARAHIPLGLMQVPLSHVVGTSTKSRSYAFAANFMPILDPNSEFSTKWARLYDGILEDGLRQPVTALEYLNKYYLIEGNKRVSVMKYLDSVFIEAEVTRIMPARTDELENRIYFEFLPFFADTGINFIWFSREGRFQRLIELTGHTPGEKWSSEDCMTLRAAYMGFRNEFKALYGDRLLLTTGDAFLTYLSIYSYADARDKISRELMQDLKNLKDEFERLGVNENVSLIMEPSEARSRGLLSALFGPSKIKAAFLYHRSPEDSGWNYWHDLGRLNAENALGDRLETTSYVMEDISEFEQGVERAIRDGNTLIFATSPLMLDASIRPSIQNPQANILCCSLLASYAHVRSYYLRIYEAKYLIGMIAGALTRNDRVGYIADYPIYGVAASINAFAMGARMVNPRARVDLEWSTKADFDPADPFKGRDVRVISNRDINAPKHSSMEYGLYTIDENGVNNLAIPVLDWSKFYESIILSVLSGGFADEKSDSSALDYWWGMSSDALDIVVSSRFDPYLNRLLHYVQSGLQSDQFWPFEGELRSQDGVIRCPSESRLTPADIVCMDWLLDNIDGGIPAIGELRENARPIVRMQGLGQIHRPDASAFNWKYNG